jgi:DNA-binding response OmpR family regulator
MMRQFLAQLLGKKFGVTVTASAEEALVQLQEHTLPDVIITDYNLEGMSGISLLKILKESSSLSAIPVIILSGDGRSENRIRCLQAGAVDFVVKPFNPVELTLKIDRLLPSSEVAPP